MSKPENKAEMKIIQIDKAAHAAIKSLAAQEGESMPETATKLINIGLNSTKQDNE